MNTPQEPQQYGRYQLKTLIGRGGMSAVYLAYDPASGRDVSIKILHPDLISHTRYWERFQQEAQTIASLEHYAIVPLYDVGQDHGRPYLVMRYLIGGTLRDRLSQPHPITPATLSLLFNRLVAALNKAHQREIYHRDIKPDNILYDEDNLPYLADFGISRHHTASNSGTVIGTPGYMAPEQVQGRVDARTDVYQLGVVLHETLTQKLPQWAEDGQLLPPQHHRPELDPAYTPLLARALAHTPQDRYPSVHALLQDLNVIIPPSAPPVPTPLPASRQQYTQSQAVTTTPRFTPPEPSLQTDDSPQNFNTVYPSPASPPNRRPFYLLALFAALILFAIIYPNFTASDNSPTPRPTFTPTTIAVSNLPTASATPSATLTLPPPATLTLPPSATPPLPTPTSLPTNTPILTAGTARLRTIDNMTQLYVPEGSFRMGTNLETAVILCQQYDTNSPCDPSWFEGETPAHIVNLDPFWIDQTEVTNAQFIRFLDETAVTPTQFQEWLLPTNQPITYTNNSFSVPSNLNNHPVNGIDWPAANQYCRWVGGRLPTEAEWEYAARGPFGNLWPWGNTFDPTRLNCAPDSCPNDGFVTTAPVGSFPTGRSWINADDMAGNVWEWVNDWYSDTYYPNSPVTNPTGPTIGASHPLRGGAWSRNIRHTRSSVRVENVSGFVFTATGFRCAQSP
ncbi:MAG TPA: bifunctional serine/threonine-protein kinase/formylglycine-generating enzyme family protein [Anaerolineae bacterium]|nr:bifunctional serine/threonine-protein kinase/formylglycine-generating enzyme family protein [Anaerolineae bacterium]